MYKLQKKLNWHLKLTGLLMLLAVLGTVDCFIIQIKRLLCNVCRLLPPTFSYIIHRSPLSISQTCPYA